MGIWNSTLVYVGARTLLAGAMIALVLRRRLGAWHTGGQIVSDLSCAAFLLAYVNPDIRDDVGILVIPLLLFVLYWEASRFLEWRRASAEGDETEESLLDSVLRLYGVVWAVGFVLPAMLAGGFLMLELVAPGDWPFPNPRPDIACAPRRLQSGATLTVRMTVPHGGEMTVFTPKGRVLVVVPFVAKTVGMDPARTFRYVENVALRTDTVAGRRAPGSPLEPVFTDTGVYVVSISEEAELSASRVCRVRFTTSSERRG
jgi:hypothetical protein